ncbi:hypothetical protein ACKC9G_07965 [Pokkaliibacter sp. CJK22405]|uniref:hypothetical protein n=1 Tax=Pokkaliibacter sp. CJK22405 TaxID=3384615 RepID=UPI00398503FD
MGLNIRSGFNAQLNQITQGLGDKLNRLQDVLRHEISAAMPHSVPQGFAGSPGSPQLPPPMRPQSYSPYQSQLAMNGMQMPSAYAKPQQGGPQQSQGQALQQGAPNRYGSPIQQTLQQSRFDQQSPQAQRPAGDQRPPLPARNQHQSSPNLGTQARPQMGARPNSTGNVYQRPSNPDALNDMNIPTKTHVLVEEPAAQSTRPQQRPQDGGPRPQSAPQRPRPQSMNSQSAQTNGATTRPYQRPANPDALVLNTAQTSYELVEDHAPQQQRPQQRPQGGPQARPNSAPQRPRPQSMNSQNAQTNSATTRPYQQHSNPDALPMNTVQTSYELVEDHAPQQQRPQQQRPQQARPQHTHHSHSHQGSRPTSTASSHEDMPDFSQIQTSADELHMGSGNVDNEPKYTAHNHIEQDQIASPRPQRFTKPQQSELLKQQENEGYVTDPKFYAPTPQPGEMRPQQGADASTITQQDQDDLAQALAEFGLPQGKSSFTVTADDFRPQNQQAGNHSPTSSESSDNKFSTDMKAFAAQHGAVDMSGLHETSAASEVKRPDSGFKGNQFPLTAKMDSRYQNEHIAGRHNNFSADFGLSARVQYLNPKEREHFELHIKDGLIYNNQGKLFDTNGFNTPAGGAGGIFVIDPSNGKLYGTADHENGRFQHSSFLAGGDVGGAGEFIVSNGRLQEMSRVSGHYKPSVDMLNQTVQHLKDQGLDMSSALVDKEIMSPELADVAKDFLKEL